MKIKIDLPRQIYLSKRAVGKLVGAREQYPLIKTVEFAYRVRIQLLGSPRDERRAVLIYSRGDYPGTRFGPG